MHRVVFLPHTADIRMKVEADSPEEIFTGAVEGMQTLIKPGFQNDDGQQHSQEVVVESPDRTSLLVDFLNRVLSLSQINKTVFGGLDILELNDRKISALLSGAAEDKWDEDIKAVTYHEARFNRKENGNWECNLIIDI